MAINYYSMLFCINYLNTLKLVSRREQASIYSLNFVKIGFKSTQLKPPKVQVQSMW